jgi:hypothetical protein
MTTTTTEVVLLLLVLQPNLVDLAVEEFGDDATSPMAKFRNVLQSKGMSDMIIALREAICVLHLRNNERGAISSDRKYNSLGALVCQR